MNRSTKYHNGEKKNTDSLPLSCLAFSSSTSTPAHGCSPPLSLCPSLRALQLSRLQVPTVPFWWCDQGARAYTTLTRWTKTKTKHCPLIRRLSFYSRQWTVRARHLSLSCLLHQRLAWTNGRVGSQRLGATALRHPEDHWKLFGAGALSRTKSRPTSFECFDLDRRISGGKRDPPHKNIQCPWQKRRSSC